MASLRSLVTRTLIDQAGASHNCQRDSSHRIAKGERRLKVKNNRSWDHYCLSCARLILQKDLTKIQDLIESVNPPVGQFVEIEKLPIA